MALTCGTGPEPVAPPRPSREVVADIASRVRGTVLVLDSYYADAPLPDSICDEWEQAQRGWDDEVCEADALLQIGGEPDTQALEAAGRALIAASELASGVRALLVATRMQPEVEAARKVLEEHGEVTGRIDPVRSRLDCVSLCEQFRKEGLLP